MQDSNGTPTGIRKYIGLISILIGIYGLISAIFTWVYPPMSFLSAWNTFMVVNFQIFIPNLGNHLEIVFHLMLLTGGIFYLKAGLDRSGLLRFCYSIIFFSSLIRFILNLFRLIHPVSEEFNFVLDGGQALAISLPYAILLLYYSYLAIRSMESDLLPDIQVNQIDFEINPMEVVATKFQRFVHFALDLTIGFALMNPFMYLADELFQNAPSSLHSTMFLGVLITHRFIYWYSLEKTFQSTPAKYLTGTRVVDEDGNINPSAWTILHRTICRFIPFEPLTFLGQNGLHDKLSHTKVVMQVNAKPGHSYSFIWIGTLLVIWIGHYGIGYYSQAHKEDQITVFENHINQIRQKDLVSHLSPDHLIVYTHEPESYISHLRAFIIEHVTSDSVSGYSFNVSSSVTNNLYGLNAALQDSVKSEKQHIARKDIDSIFLNARPGKLFATDSLYSIKGIYIIGQPVMFRPNGSNSHPNDDGTRSVTWSIPIEQSQVTLISIENLEGDIIWANILPEKIDWNPDKNEGKLYLTANNITDEKKYKGLLTMKDSDGQLYSFFIEGIGGRIYFYRKYLM